MFKLLRNKLKQLLDKLLRRDELLTLQLSLDCQLKQTQYYQGELVEAQLQAESYKIYLEQKDKKIERLEASLESMDTERVIELPQFEVEELKKTLKMADVFTMNMIIDYLKSDIYHLVKNTAKTINKSNYAEVSIFMDGAIGRDEALMKVLKESVAGRSFINRKVGEEQQVNRQKNS